MSGYVYFGTSDFAAGVLEGLCRNGHRPRLVVTPPDRRRGRGKRLSATPVADMAEELGLTTLKTEDVNLPEARQAITETGSEIAMVCAFGQIVKEPLLSQVLMLNVHPSLLPRWRGAAPIERAIMAGDTETGVCIIKLEAGLDSGPIASERRVPIDDDDFGALSKRLVETAVEAASAALDAAATGEIAFTPQPDEGVTYAEKIDRAERLLDPSVPAAAVAAKVRALTPHIGAILEFEDGSRLGVESARVVEGQSTLKEGEVVDSGNSILLGCSVGVLGVDRVKPPGKGVMSVADYLRGNDLPATRVRSG